MGYYSPSCPRHTFATRAKQMNVDEYAIKMIIGHERWGVTEKHYTHREVLGEWLYTEISKIK